MTQRNLTADTTDAKITKNIPGTQESRKVFKFLFRGFLLSLDINA